MFLQKERAKTGKFINYSHYGVQNYIIVNEYGVPFTVNSDGVVYDNYDESRKGVKGILTTTAEIQELIKIESHKSFKSLEK